MAVAPSFRTACNAVPSSSGLPISVNGVSANSGADARKLKEVPPLSRRRADSASRIAVAPTDIERLRELHVELDYAVRDAYGWTDLQLDHHHWETPQGMRFTVSPAAKDELLDRLLELNHQRYAEEVAAGLHDKKGSKSVKRGKPAVRDFALFGEAKRAQTAYDRSHSVCGRTRLHVNVPITTSCATRPTPRGSARAGASA